MLSLYVQFFVFMCMQSMHCLNALADITTFTEVQSFNSYCDSPRNVGIDPRMMKIVCNFRNSAARLGKASVFKETIAQQGGDLHLEINNCSKLYISTAFYTWRDVFSTLHLTIENVDEVFQEEIVDRATSIPTTRSAFISLSLRNSKIASISPMLVSDTKTLMMSIDNCHIETIAKDAFHNVLELGQFRILKSNITRISNGAMPHALPVTSPRATTDLEWSHYLFNETRIGLLDTDAIRLDITGKDEFLNVVNCSFETVRKGGLQISGTGHVLLVDSRFQQLDDDSIIVSLKGNDSPCLNLSPINCSTLNFLGLDIFSVNITNLLLNLQISNGKLYLIRMSFLFPGAYSAIASLDKTTLPHLWNQNQTFIERWSAKCNCQDVSNYFHERRLSVQPKIPTIANLHQSETNDYEYDYQRDRIEKTTSLSGWHIIQELQCFQEGPVSIDLADFKLSYCPETSTFRFEDGSTPSEIPYESSNPPPINNDHSFAWYMGIIAMCIIVSTGILGSVCIIRRQRKKFGIAESAKYVNRPKSAKQVGVISEDPICGCDEVEECQV